MNEKNTIWESAGKAGLILGGVSIAYMLLSYAIDLLGLGILSGLLGALLWLAKLGGCIYLMRFLMQRFSQDNPEADNGRVLRFGLLTALLSALLYSGAYLAYFSFIRPDFFETMMDTMLENPMFDAAMQEQMEAMMPKMPTYMFWTNLIYCWLWGAILSAIFSRNIPSKNPFA
ncbi:MAG: DUF4199 domain-containing protein [Bacteroidales bacterium]|nr:DUF4199 domain-containing protein [Bacteroidales bacterium]